MSKVGRYFELPVEDRKKFWREYFFRPWRYVRIWVDVGKFFVGSNGREYVGSDDVVRRTQYCNECGKTYMMRVLHLGVGNSKVDLWYRSLCIFHDIIVGIIMPFLGSDAHNLGSVNTKYYQVFRMYFEAHWFNLWGNTLYTIRSKPVNSRALLCLFPDGKVCGNMCCIRKSRYNRMSFGGAKGRPLNGIFISSFNLMPLWTQPLGTCNLSSIHI